MPNRRNPKIECDGTFRFRKAPYKCRLSKGGPNRHLGARPPDVVLAGVLRNLQFGQELAAKIWLAAVTALGILYFGKDIKGGG